MDVKKTQGFVEAMWDRDILPSLKEYITIPALSPDFDTEWEKTGQIDRAMRLIAEWCGSREIPGMKLEIVKLPGRSPLLFMEIPGKTAETVMLYGHMDKQPPVTGWREGLGPWTPVIEDGKLYGRGGADDGYAAYTALAAIEAVQAQGHPHARCVVLIEAAEESGSPDLPDYIEHLKARIGVPSLIVCLVSGAGNYDQLWSTTSLRGLVAGKLTVQVLREGAHSGGAGGVVPSSFRIAREILSRIEDERTGEILLPEFHVEIPAARRKQIAEVAKVLGDAIITDWPMMPGMKPMGEDVAELILNNTWRPSLAVVGADGLPPTAGAGKRAAGVHHAQAVAAAAAERGSGAGAGQGQAGAGERSSLRRFGAVRPRGTGERVGRAAAGPVAGEGARPVVQDVLRQAGVLHGRGGLDPLHGHAGGEVPQGAVPHHRGAGAAVERARAERVPAHPGREEADLLHRARSGRAGAGVGGGSTSTPRPLIG